MNQELYTKLMNKPVPLLTDSVQRKWKESPAIPPLAFQNKNKLLLFKKRVEGLTLMDLF